MSRAQDRWSPPATWTTQQRVRRSLVPLAGMQFEMIQCTQAFAMAQLDPVEFVPRMLVQSPVALEDLAQVGSVTYLLRPKDTARA